MWKRAELPVFNSSVFTGSIVDKVLPYTQKPHFGIVTLRSKNSFTYIPK
jgi:hypothetical protein